MIASARNARHMRLKDLTQHILKADGTSISIPYLGLIEQDRFKPSPGLIPQFAAVLDIPEDGLYLALGLLPPDVRKLSSAATYRQVLDAFQIVRKISLLLMKVCQVPEINNAKTSP